MSRHAVVVVLALILTAAAILRSVGLEESCLSRDEASSWRVSDYAIWPLVWHCAANVHPPAYFLILKAWTALAGDSPAALRGLSVVFGLASVGAAFAVAAGIAARQQSPPLGSAGLIAATFLALAPLQIELSQTARMYSLGVLFAAITTRLLIEALHRPGSAFRWWIG
jgi:uncharacterized membrane protein